MNTSTLKWLQLGFVACILASWQLSVFFYQPEYLPGLNDIFQAWRFHWFEGNLKGDLSATLIRVAISFSLAMIVGVIIGILLGTFRGINKVFEPLLLFFLNLPALVAIILCYIWIGLVETAAILAVFINKLPTVIVAMREGARVIDKDLMELAKVYKVSPMRTFTKVYMPQLYPYLLAASRNGLALIWKIVLVVELLGRSDGIGFGLHSLFQFFDIAGILAYAFSFMLIMIMVDTFIFSNLEKAIQRGRD